jgi:hypothetical protein
MPGPGSAEYSDTTGSKGEPFRKHSAPTKVSGPSSSSWNKNPNLQARSPQRSRFTARNHRYQTSPDSRLISFSSSLPATASAAAWRSGPRLHRIGFATASTAVPATFRFTCRTACRCPLRGKGRDAAALHKNLDYCETIGFHFCELFSNADTTGSGMVLPTLWRIVTPVRGASRHHSVMMRSAHSTSSTKIFGLPHFAPELVKSASVTSAQRDDGENCRQTHPRLLLRGLLPGPWEASRWA